MASLQDMIRDRQLRSVGPQHAAVRERAQLAAQFEADIRRLAPEVEQMYGRVHVEIRDVPTAGMEYLHPGVFVVQGDTMDAGLGHDELEALLLHEIAHALRGDSFLEVLGPVNPGDDAEAGIRQAEEAADRLAVSRGAKPQALITGLRKCVAHNLRFLHNAEALGYQVAGGSDGIAQIESALLGDTAHGPLGERAARLGVAFDPL